MVRTQRPEANGATVTAGGVGRCYAEFGMTGRNDNAGWESAFLCGDEDWACMEALQRALGGNAEVDCAYEEWLCMVEHFHALGYTFGFTLGYTRAFVKQGGPGGGPGPGPGAAGPGATTGPAPGVGGDGLAAGSDGNAGEDLPLTYGNEPGREDEGDGSAGDYFAFDAQFGGPGSDDQSGDGSGNRFFSKRVYGPRIKEESPK